MVAFLKIILYAVLIFYVTSMVIRLIFKHKLRKLEHQMKQETIEDEQESQQNQKPHIDPNIGEYTDFEEVE